MNAMNACGRLGDTVTWADAGYLGDHDLLLRAAVVSRDVHHCLLTHSNPAVNKFFTRRLFHLSRPMSDGIDHVCCYTARVVLA